MKVARLPGRILRWGFSTRPGSSRFLAPSVLFCFRNGQKVKMVSNRRENTLRYSDGEKEREKRKKEQLISHLFLGGVCNKAIV